MTRNSAVRLIYAAHLPLMVVFICAAVVGLMLLLYIINLRGDAILYARTVNSIRRLFRDQSRMTIKQRMQSSVLPETKFQPPYHEFPFFYPVVISFATLNTLYAYFAVLLYGFQGQTLSLDQLKATLTPSVWGWLVVGAIFLIHLILYKGMAVYREKYYLQSRLVGVDIDGVLNEHRIQFADVFKQQTGRTIDPNEIRTIPVHKDPKLGVKKEDADRVFESPEYWLSMPAKDGAAKILERITDEFGIQPLVFTNRNWVKKEKKKDWRIQIRTHWKAKPRRLSERTRDWLRVLSSNPIRFITLKWLKSHGFTPKKVLVNIGKRRFWTRETDRFKVARAENIRFFVEDDLANAVRLSDTCQVVFLIDQPYNPSDELPPNVLRVESWEDLYERMRELV